MYNCMNQAKKNKRIVDNLCEDVLIPEPQQQEDDEAKFMDSSDILNIFKFN